jgi:hypothetical protein
MDMRHALGAAPRGVSFARRSFGIGRCIALVVMRTAMVALRFDAKLDGMEGVPRCVVMRVGVRRRGREDAELRQGEAQDGSEKAASPVHPGRP